MVNESIHIMQLIKEVQLGTKQHIFDIPDHTDPQPHPAITLHTDSTSTSSLASKLGVNNRSCRISLKHLWLQDEYKKGVVNITHVPTSDNPADLFSKLLPALDSVVKLHIKHRQQSQHPICECCRRRTTNTAQLNNLSAPTDQHLPQLSQLPQQRQRSNSLDTIYINMIDTVDHLAATADTVADASETTTVA